MGVRPTFLISAAFAAVAGGYSGSDVRAFGDTCLCPLYADVYPQSGGDRNVNLDDILCVLSGFTSSALCPGADVAPCGSDGTINLDDILAVLNAFGGSFNCPHPNCPVDETPPTVSITAPAASSILSGLVVVTADATDDFGVAGVQFQVDGNAVG